MRKIVRNNSITSESLRADVKYMLNNDWEPKIPKVETILKQSKKQLNKGKSTGSVGLDKKVLNHQGLSQN